MAYLSQDLQKICLNFINKKQVPDKDRIPNSFLKAAKKYNPRLGILLRAENKKVFESDLKLLANFFQNSAFSRQVSPNKYQEPYSVQKKFHKQTYGIKTQRDLDEIKKDDRKQKSIDKRLQSIRNPTGSAEMEEIIKKANIKKARDLSTRQERAREYVKKIVDERRKSGANKNILGAMADENKTAIDTNATSNPQPIKISDLIV
ncbi:MAG: hypothetical protein ABH896_01420 [Candidatus Jacksonbacteria bacterium]